MTISRMSTSSLKPYANADIQRFTSGSGTYVVPAGCRTAHIVVVAGGQSGGSDTNSDPLTGGHGGQVVVQDVVVTPGETISYTVGAGGTGGNLVAGSNSTCSGTFGTITALASTGAATDTDGTYDSVFGWLGGGGAGCRRAPSNASMSNKVPSGGGGTGMGAWGGYSVAATAGVDGTGGGGGAGGNGTATKGGTGFVGISVR